MIESCPLGQDFLSTKMCPGHVFSSSIFARSMDHLLQETPALGLTIVAPQARNLGPSVRIKLILQLNSHFISVFSYYRPVSNPVCYVLNRHNHTCCCAISLCAYEISKGPSPGDDTDGIRYFLSLSNHDIAYGDRRYAHIHTIRPSWIGTS